MAKKQGRDISTLSDEKEKTKMGLKQACPQTVAVCSLIFTTAGCEGGYLRWDRPIHLCISYVDFFSRQFLEVPK